VPELKLAYNNCTTTGGNTTATATIDFKVTTPLNGWQVTTE
jgi:hypothetical protein